jgi:hypothetical protein
MSFYANRATPPRSAPYTAEDRAWLRHHWGGEFTFLRAYCLSIFDEGDREEGRRIARCMMAHDREYNTEPFREARDGRRKRDGRGTGGDQHGGRGAYGGSGGGGGGGGQAWGGGHGGQQGGYPNSQITTACTQHFSQPAARSAEPPPRYYDQADFNFASEELAFVREGWAALSYGHKVYDGGDCEHARTSLGQWCRARTSRELVRAVRRAHVHGALVIGKKGGMKTRQGEEAPYNGVEDMHWDEGFVQEGCYVGEGYSMDDERWEYSADAESFDYGAYSDHGGHSDYGGYSDYAGYSDDD